MWQRLVAPKLGVIPFAIIFLVRRVQATLK
jgi:hypothetical protein